MAKNNHENSPEIFPPKISEDLNHAFGQVVRKTRKAAGISVEELSQQSNVYIDRVYKIERGAAVANLMEIAKLAWTLKMRAGEILVRAEVLAEIGYRVRHREDCHGKA